jgi:transposase
VTKRYIKPARQGLVVRQPQNGQPLPQEGAWVDWSGHWIRRKAEGSIVEATPAATPKAKPNGAALKQKEAD